MTNRRSHLTLLGLLLAALAGVAALAIPASPVHKSVKKGLDLQGGLEVVLEAVPPKGRTLTKSDLSRSVNIMRERVDKLGVSEPEIRQQGSNQIVIQLAGVHDPDKAAKIIGKTAQLELYDLETSLIGPSVSAGTPVANDDLYSLLSRARAYAGNGPPSTYYLFNKKKKPVAGPATTVKELLAGPRFRGHQPRGFKVFPVPAKMVVATCTVADQFCPGPQGGVQATRTLYYLFKHGKYAGKDFPAMNGNDLKLSGIRADIDPNGGPIVTMRFTGKGNGKFHQITKDEWNRGQIQGPQHFAIVLDNDIKSFPQIDPKDATLSNGIDPSGTGAQIENIGNLSEAKSLALVLQTGALPVNFVQKERTDVSATLGKDSLREAQRAAIAGLIVVALFLLLLYRFLGLVAVVGLAIYVAFLYAAILLLGVTMTLPGFAGLILTIGVAADANVVIFERIKEESRAGKSMRAAIAAGYGKGFHTILDANVVTLITALVLFAVATAGVKGFALMLIVGTVISLVTAVAATRAMLGLLAGFRWFDNPRFMGAHGEQGLKFLQIDFMRRRYLWFAISGAVVVLGVGSLAIKGLNLGIDFKGGTQITFKTPQAVSLSKVRQQTAAIGESSAVVQGRGKLTGRDSYRSFQIRTEALKGKSQASLTNSLNQQLKATNLGVNTVSSSFGRQIARAALLAIFFSLFLIVLYIGIRFDIKYAVPVIVALIHDIVVTIGVYSLTGREVTTATVAAVLTVLGYSIYDTIIIFDRVRENVPLMRRASFASIANISLWETIRRSLATTFITLLPVGALLFFGGATLKDFAFALLIGIASGAYSSIFIAAPLLTIWKEREPEWAKRMSADLEGARPTSAIAPARVAAAGGDGESAVVDSRSPSLEEATEAAAWSPTPEPFSEPAPQPGSSAEARRERRRQRRRARPHGRPR